MLAAEGVRALLSLFAIIGVILLAAMAARKAGLAGASGGLLRKRRLAVIETLALDTRRRLAIVKCDGREHLILFGTNSDTLIASDLNGAPADEMETPAKVNPLTGLERLTARYRASQKQAA